MTVEADTLFYLRFRGIADANYTMLAEMIRDTRAILEQAEAVLARRF